MPLVSLPAAPASERKQGVQRGERAAAARSSSRISPATRLVSGTSAVGISQWPVVVRNRSSANLGSWPVPNSAVVAHQERHGDLGIAVLPRLQVEHELAERPLQPRRAGPTARRSARRTAWRRGRSPCPARAPSSSCGRGAKSKSRGSPQRRSSTLCALVRAIGHVVGEDVGEGRRAAASSRACSRRAARPRPAWTRSFSAATRPAARRRRRSPLAAALADLARQPVAASPGPPAAGSRARGARHRARARAAAAGGWPRRASARSNASGCSRSHLRSITARHTLRHGLDGGSSGPGRAAPPAASRPPPPRPRLGAPRCSNHAHQQDRDLVEQQQRDREADLADHVGRREDRRGDEDAARSRSGGSWRSCVGA